MEADEQVEIDEQVEVHVQVEVDDNGMQTLNVSWRQDPLLVLTAAS